MFELKIALRNVFRHKLRSLATLSSIIFGCISIMFTSGHFEDIFNKMRESYINSQTGHIQIYKLGYSEKGTIQPFDYLIEDPQKTIEFVEKIPGVLHVTKRIAFAGLLSTGETNAGVIVQGVQPEFEGVVSENDNVIYSRDDDYSKMRGAVTLKEGSGLKQEDNFSILVGQGLARSIGAKVGDVLVLASNTAGGSFNAIDAPVSGIFLTSSKEFDDRAIRLSLSGANSLLGTESVQSLVVVLEKTSDTEAVANEIGNYIRDKNAQLEFKTWNELNDFYTKTTEMFSTFFFVILMVVVVIVALSIFNTMSMSVMERVIEIGTIMAMGAKRSQIIRLFMLEGLALGLVGALVGVSIGCIVLTIVGEIGITMPPAP